MSTKILHIKNGFVAAVTFPNEPVAPYGDLVEVDVALDIGVGDPAPEVEAAAAAAQEATEAATEAAAAVGKRKKTAAAEPAAE